MSDQDELNLLELEMKMKAEPVPEAGFGDFANFFKERAADVGRIGGERLFTTAGQSFNTTGQLIGEIGGALASGDWGHFFDNPDPPTTKSELGIPSPTGNTIFALTQLLGEGAAALASGDFSGFDVDTSAADLFGKAKFNQMMKSAQVKADSPTTAFVSKMGADAFSVLGLRKPGRGAANKAKQLITPAIKSNAARAIVNLKNSNEMTTAISRIFTSSPMKTLFKGLGHVGEAGLEGVAIAAINGDDPVLTSGFAMGTQTGSSIILQGIESTMAQIPKGFGKLAKLTATAAGLTTLYQVAKEAFPGGKNYILESEESSYKKIMLGIVAGTTIALIGGGRIDPNKKGAFQGLPRLSEALTTLPRVSTQGVLREVFVAEEAGNTDPSMVLSTLVSDPSAFGEFAAKKIDEAVSDENISFVDVVNALKDTNEEFQTGLSIAYDAAKNTVIEAAQ